MVNWKTTLCGALAALGAYLMTVTDPTWLHTIGSVLGALSTAAIGFFAADANKVAPKA